MIRAGDRIKIKPEFQDEGDDLLDYVAVDDEDGGRILVRCLIPWWTFHPTSIIETRMIEERGESCDFRHQKYDGDS